MITIGIDLMGGDYAPDEAQKGITQFLSSEASSGVTVAAIGLPETADSLLQNSRVTFYPANEVIGMGEHATRAVSQKRNASINIGMRMMAEGKVDAFIGAGHTGAMMVSSLYTVKAIEGVLRPAISTILPKANGGSGLMLDVGANADVKPEVLNQFATIGSVYCRNVMGIEQPRIGLLSIGEEKEKGNLLTQAAYGLLEDNRNINFIGNIEGRDLFLDKADVVVCDGFTGNIILKTCEGFYYNLRKRSVKDEYLDRFNFEKYGGTAILGINKPVIIGHGISKAGSFENMLKLAKDIVETKLIDKIKSAL